MPVLLIARAFLWQNRWLLAAFVCWPILLGAFTWSPQKGADPADVTEIVQQEVFYGLAVMAFLAGSAIHNERRSRRIVTVLSKAVSRSQYLRGLLVGAIVFAGAYFVMIAAVFLLMMGLSFKTLAGSASVLFSGIVAALWVSSLALTFSTFLHSLLAGFLAGAAGFSPLALKPHLLLLPLTRLIGNVNPFSFEISWPAISVSCAQALIFFLVGAKILARRDLAAAVE